MYTRVNKQERLMSNYRISWKCVRLGSETMTHHVSPLFTEHSFCQSLVVQLWLKSIYVNMFSCQCEILSTVLPHVSVGYYTSPLSMNNLCVIVGIGVVPVFLHNICTGSGGCVLVVKTDIMASSLGKSWAYQHEEIHSPSWEWPLDCVLCSAKYPMSSFKTGIVAM